jgi:hypothetical protein
MRTTRFASALLLAFVLGGAGCYESLTSIVTPDKQVFYEDLVGEYEAVEPATGRVTIEKGADKAYAYRQYDDKGALANKGRLRLIKLGDDHFYEITADRLNTLEGKPLYAVGRLAIEGEKGARTLTGYAFETKDAFFEGTGVVTAEYRYKEEGQEKKGRALSMSPEALQAYLAAHAKEMTERGLRLRQTKAAE